MARQRSRRMLQENTVSGTVAVRMENVINSVITVVNAVIK